LRDARRDPPAAARLKPPPPPFDCRSTPDRLPFDAVPTLRQKLTVRVLESLKPGAIARDSTCPGFFAEAGKTGVSFKVQVDFRLGPRTGTARDRKSLRITLGRYGVGGLTLDAARAEAARLLAEAKAGRDPRVKVVNAETWTVGHAFKQYVANLGKRPGSELSQRDMLNRLTRYLDDWRDVPLASLTRELCEARQLKIQKDVKARAANKRATGARAANATIKDISAVWTFASDFVPLPPANPCRKITLIGEVKAHHEIPMNELGAWWKAVGDLKNPLRRALHRFGVLSALRPGNLLTIERAWIRLDDRRIAFPASAMKGRRPFVLPLSAPMLEQVREALAAGDVLEKGSPYLFPSRGNTGVVQPMVVSREKALALRDRTGHALRHTWKTCARNARLPESQIMLLMAHRLGGMSDTYGSLAEQFDRLLADQETVSAFILARVGAVAVQPLE
jgi:integrase